MKFIYIITDEGFLCLENTKENVIFSYLLLNINEMYYINAENEDEARLRGYAYSIRDQETKETTEGKLVSIEGIRTPNSLEEVSNKMNDVERSCWIKILGRYDNNLSKISKEYGINRKTIYRKLKKLGIERQTSWEKNEDINIFRHTS